MICVDSGWIGDPMEWKKGTASIVPAAKFAGDQSQMCWLPSKRTAAVWQAFVSPHAKQVKIAEPPGLGDGQPFALHSPRKPVKIRVTVDGKLRPASVQVWDADAKVAERSEGPWEFDVSLKPGVHGLIVRVIDEDQWPRLSRPHTIVVPRE